MGRKIVNNTNINKLRKELKNSLKRVAKRKLKTDISLKNVAKGIKQHFRKKDAWPLSYETYREMSRQHSLLFIQALLLINMKIYFCKKTEEVVFKKEAK